MFYGEGAGTRRKLIKNTVDAKAKRDASYKKAFDFHLEKQDMSRHAEKARSERGRKDTVNTVQKTARGVKNILVGNMMYAPVAAFVVVGAYRLMKDTGWDKKLIRYAKDSYEQASRSPQAAQAKSFIQDLMKKAQRG